MQPTPKCKYCKNIINKNIHDYSHDQDADEYICKTCLRVYNAGYVEGKHFMKDRITDEINRYIDY